MPVLGMIVSDFPASPEGVCAQLLLVGNASMLPWALVSHPSACESRPSNQEHGDATTHCSVCGLPSQNADSHCDMLKDCSEPILDELQVLSLLLCGIALIYLLARGEHFRNALGFIVVLLVASIPIAIEIVR